MARPSSQKLGFFLCVFKGLIKILYKLYSASLKYHVDDWNLFFLWNNPPTPSTTVGGANTSPAPPLQRPWIGSSLHTSHDGVTKERLQTPGSLQYFDAWDNTKYSPEWGFSGNPRNLRFFGEKSPKLPKLCAIPVPKISPIPFLGFSGIKPQ